MTMLEHALYLASQGFYVFPVTANKKMPPLLHNFPVHASRDEETIRMWWTITPTANIAISTTIYFNKLNEESEALLVVDVDTKEGKMGEDELLRLELEGNDFPTTREQRTPSGGRHLIYRVKSPTGQPKLAPSIDIRSKGGYILGAGSVLSNGTYVLSDGEVQPAPEWLVSRCNRSTPQSNNTVEYPTSGVSQNYAISRARDYLKTSASKSIQGAGGNHTAFTVAARIRDLGVDQSGCWTLMIGEWNDECQPPWNINELGLIVHNAYSYAQNPQGIASPEATFTPIVEEEPTKESRKSRFEGKYLHQINPDFKKEFLVEKLLSPRSVSIVYGESGEGKTFFSLDLALHISLGQTWRSKKINPGLVVYVAAEGGFGVQKRILGFRKYHNIENRTDVPFVLIDDSLDLKKDLKDLLLLIKDVELHFKQKTVLVVIDTLMRAFGGGNENEAQDMAAFIKGIDEIKKNAGAHVLIVHHSGKDASKGMRGHSSLKAAIDTEILIEDNTAKVKKQRDMDQCAHMEFRLQTIKIGMDADGNSVETCVVLEANTSATKDFSKPPLDPKSINGKGFRALHNAIQMNPHAPPDSLDLPADTFVTTIEEWRNEVFAVLYPGEKFKESHRTTFLRIVSSLYTQKYIKKDSEFVWINE